MRTNCHFVSVALLTALSFFPSPARAGDTLLGPLNAAVPANSKYAIDEHFNTNTGSTAATLSAYPGYTFFETGAVDATATVVSNRLQLVDTTNDAGIIRFETVPNLPSASTNFVVQARIGESGSPGSTSPAIVIGNRAFGFFPGFGGGAFRIYDNAGNTILSNTAMGFNPAEGVLYQWQIDVNPNTKTFDISVTDTNSPFSTFTYSTTQAGWVAGSVGLMQNFGTGTVFFDDFQVSYIEILTPEPTSLMLFGITAVLLFGAHRHLRRRRLAVG